MTITRAHFSNRNEQISAIVLEILAAIAPREMSEGSMFNLVRMGPVKDVTRAELKAELVACEAAGWADAEVRSHGRHCVRGVYWYGTKAAVAARAGMDLRQS